MRLDLKNQYLVAANGQMLRLTPGQVAKIHKSFDRIRSTDQMIKKLRDSDKFEARLAARETDRYSRRRHRLVVVGLTSTSTSEIKARGTAPLSEQLSPRFSVGIDQGDLTCADIMESITDITVEFNAKKLDYYEALGQTFLDNVGEANPRKIQIPDGDVELPDFGKEIDAMELEVLIYDIQSLAFQLNYLASIFWLNACGQGDGTQAVTIPSGGDGGLGGGDPSGSSSCSQQLGYIEVSYDGGSTWSTSWSGEVWVCPDQEVY